MARPFNHFTSLTSKNTLAQLALRDALNEVQTTGGLGEEKAGSLRTYLAGTVRQHETQDASEETEAKDSLLVLLAELGSEAIRSNRLANLHKALGEHDQLLPQQGKQDRWGWGQDTPGRGKRPCSLGS